MKTKIATSKMTLRILSTVLSFFGWHHHPKDFFIPGNFSFPSGAGYSRSSLRRRRAGSGRRFLSSAIRFSIVRKHICVPFFVYSPMPLHKSCIISTCEKSICCKGHQIFTVLSLFFHDCGTSFTIVSLTEKNAKKK